MSANTANTPATMPKTAPLISFVTFSVISAFASSISSWISSCAFSVMSWTALSELARLLVGRHSAILLRMRANTNAPANAAAR